MSDTIIPFSSGEWNIRAVTIDGEPWFVARDVTGILGIAQTGVAVSALDPDEVTTTHLTDALGRKQDTYLVSEAGLYTLILRSRKPQAKTFKRWITHEVIPSIRKTGGYGTPAALDLRSVEGIRAVIEAGAAALAELEVAKPKADAWDALASADGDYEVADAAKILARDGIETGRQRLFTQLAELNWLYRGADRRWRAYQPPVERGYLAQRPQYHYHPATGERVIDAPQIRVTVKGLDALRRRLSKSLVVAQ
jgi:Prophage antirepressor